MTNAKQSQNLFPLYQEVFLEELTIQLQTQEHPEPLPLDYVWTNWRGVPTGPLIETGMTSVTTTWSKLSEDFIRVSCTTFRRHIEAAIKVGGEGTLNKGTQESFVNMGKNELDPYRNKDFLSFLQTYVIQFTLAFRILYVVVGVSR